MGVIARQMENSMVTQVRETRATSETARAGQMLMARQSLLTRLMLLGGIATLSVVAHHAVSFGFTMMFAWAYRYRVVTDANLLDPVGTAPYHILLTLKKLTSFSVPVFLFISGYYYAAFALRGKTSPRRIVGSRIRKLIIPYLLWSTIIFALEWLESCELHCAISSPSSYLHRLLWGKADGGYYYVILMIQFILMAPLLIHIARKRWRLLLIATALIQAAFTTLIYFSHLGVQLPSSAYPIYSSGVPFPGMIFFFALGIVIGLRLRDVEPALIRIRSWLPFAVAVLAVVVMVEPELIYPKTVSGIASRWEFRTFAVAAYATAIILCFVAFDRISLPKSRALGRLGTKIYGIYLIHYLVMSYSARLIGYFLPNLLAYQLALVPILFSLGLFIPLGLMSLVCRSPFRSAYPYLFG